MNVLLALAIFAQAERADLQAVLVAMYQLVGAVEVEWAGVAADRPLAAAKMNALTLAIHDANDGLAYLSNAKTSSTRAATVAFGLKRIREHAVSRLDDAAALGVNVQAARDAFAGVQTLPYANWQPAGYPAAFAPDGNFDAFNLAAYKGSEAVWHLYWDAVNYARVSPLWSAEATAECGQSVRDIRDLGRLMVRARAVALGVPIMGDTGSREDISRLLNAEFLAKVVDLQIAEFGKNSCTGTLADLNGGEWIREAINWRAPKAIGVPDTDNRVAEWFSDFLGMADVGPWVHAAFFPAGSGAPVPVECPSYAVEFLGISPTGQVDAVCVEVP